jgi:monoamine oxidase
MINRISRREFMEKLSLATGALLCSAPWLTACTKEEEVSPTPETLNVAIIGAGAAGLEAGYHLGQKKIPFKIFEASYRAFGRVRSWEGFSDFPIELGAEEVHGTRSVLGETVRAAGGEFLNKSSEDYLWLGGQLRAVSSLSGDTTYKKAQQFLEKIYDYKGEEISAASYERIFGVSPLLSGYTNARLGNEYGADNEKIGVRSLIKAEEERTALGSNALLKNISMEKALTERFRSVLPQIQFQTPIVHLDYSDPAAIRLTSQAGKRWEARFVILAVPLTILQKRILTFTPELPPAQWSAITALGMDGGMKILLKFSERFWADDTGSLLGLPNCPEIWVTGNGRSRDNKTLTAYINGDSAEYMGRLGNGAVQEILTTLDTAYGNNLATRLFQDSYIMDWAKEPYILGAFSYPKVGSEGAYQQISKPIQNKIFFAGEHTHPKGHFATVHGAMETGKLAAQAVITQIK